MIVLFSCSYLTEKYLDYKIFVLFFLLRFVKKNNKNKLIRAKFSEVQYLNNTRRRKAEKKKNLYSQ